MLFGCSRLHVIAPTFRLRLQSLHEFLEMRVAIQQGIIFTTMTILNSKFYSNLDLDLANEQLPNYTFRSKRHGFPEVREVEGRGECIQEPKRQHRWNPPCLHTLASIRKCWGGVGRSGLTLRKLQSPSLEDVLASLATAEVVLSSSGVTGRLNVPWLDELLFAG